MPSQQEFRAFRLKCTDGYPGESQPVFRRMTAFERLSRPYEFRVLALLERPAEGPNFELQKVLGKGFSVGAYDESAALRFFHGNCSEARFVGTERGGYLIEMVLRPAFWFATRGSNSRVFHDKAADEIISEVLNANPQPPIRLKMQINDQPKKRVYCVQYQETDFDFISRLMEEEGIFYYFSHSETGHELIISDNGKGDDRDHDFVGEVPFRPPGSALRGPQRHLSEWLIRASVEQADGNHLIGYNYEKREVFGATKPTPPPDTVAVRQNEHFPTARSKADDERYAKVWADAEVALRVTRQASGNDIRLRPGDTFELADHYLAAENRRYSVVETHHLMEGNAYNSSNQSLAAERVDVIAIPSDVKFRPKRVTPRPRVSGPQTAIVAADDQKSGEEIVTDSLGRVRVNFFWGNTIWRDGISHAKLSETSCWIRVAQIWAGKQWGALFIPRVGQEVVVAFEDGDPDRPLITGSVYNGQYPVPYSLPGHKTRTTIKSESTKGGGGFNELRFEDKKGSEELYLHAQKDMNVQVLNNRGTTVGNNETRTIEMDRTTTLNKGNESLKIKKGNRSAELDMGNDSLDLKMGNRSAELGMGNDSTTLKMGNQTTKLDLGKQETTALQSIEFKVGASSIRIDQMGVTIKGMMINIEGTVNTKVEGLITSLKAQTLMMVNGTPVMIN